MLAEESETSFCREKLVKVLEELQAQAEVALCFVGMMFCLFNSARFDKKMHAISFLALKCGCFTDILCKVLCHTLILLETCTTAIPLPPS